MSGFYTGMVKVVGVDLVCFRAKPGSLDPLSGSAYDPWAWSDPDPEPVETIDINEWNVRRAQSRGEKHG